MYKEEVILFRCSIVTSYFFVLATQGWQKPVDKMDDLRAIDRLVNYFHSPLNGADTQIQEIYAEFEAMVHYVIQYISLSTLRVSSVWWRLFHAPNSSEWNNILTLIELFFLCRHLMRRLREFSLRLT